ncbi:MAG: hypothetical protein GY851_25595 [bacterium]|nr:hypothetical protein [bacterium]
MILDDDGHPLVPIHECWTDSEAEIVVAALRAHGVTAVANSEVPHSILPLTVDGLGKIQILVTSDVEAEACQILQSLPDSADPEGEESVCDRG